MNQQDDIQPISKTEMACGTVSCNDCSAQPAPCDCGVPEAFFFKLKNHFTTEESLPVLVQSFEFQTFITEADLFAEKVHFDKKPVKLNSESPPDISPLDFLIRIQQLKIPLSA